MIIHKLSEPYYSLLTGIIINSLNLIYTVDRLTSEQVLEIGPSL
jgi:hypothetical protein